MGAQSHVCGAILSARETDCDPEALAPNPQHHGSGGRDGTSLVTAAHWAKRGDGSAGTCSVKYIQAASLPSSPRTGTRDVGLRRGRTREVNSAPGNGPEHTYHVVSKVPSCLLPQRGRDSRGLPETRVTGVTEEEFDSPHVGGARGFLGLRRKLSAELSIL